MSASKPGTPADPGLGYDPRPDLHDWRGTPIPPINNPLRLTPERQDIVERVWWNGPPWTVLRNASVYLWHVMDYGLDSDIAFTRTDVAEQLWRQALAEARPGRVSRSSYVFWSCVLGLMQLDETCDWPDNAHIGDVRPLAKDSRERMYQRFANAHHHRVTGKLPSFPSGKT